MYAAFNLKITVDDFESLSNLTLQNLIRIGQQRREHLQTCSKAELVKFTSTTGIIDGSGLSDDWFQTIQSDVFISHSHNDADLAFALAGWLKKQFELDVFMDESIWGSADALLRTIDDEYCWQPKSETYSYKKRNLTTSHVHAMLSTAIYSVMDKTEVVFFLNTSESIPKIGDTIEENSEYTLSPWIYQELMATKLLRKTDWLEYRNRTALEHAQYIKESADLKLKITYKTPLSELKILDKDALLRWKDKYIERCIHPFLNIQNHPLNYLYNTAFSKMVEK